jgi:hypothetical protein
MKNQDRWLRLLPVIFSLSLILVQWTPARADIAPPEKPSGGNPSPGSENTRVRMLSESVTLVVQDRPEPGSLGQARVVAIFDMQNTGSADETMQVRFPLTFPSGTSDGFGNFPEITDLQAKVNGVRTATQRIMLPNPSDFYENALPWSTFEVTFPPGETVQVEVSYTAEAWGEVPYLVFGYVLETGAGWQGTIGSAELVVRLPYEVNEQNVIIGESVGFGMTTSGADIVGNELRWQRSDFEPDPQDNLSILLLSPAAWEKILAEREATSQNPQDGEAWGRLGKACKEASVLRRGFRYDAGGLALYQESLAAYEKAVTLLPEDALWHFGFAELLWNHYAFHTYTPYEHEQSELVRAVGELKASLDLDPDEPRALELAQEIAWLNDGIIDPESDPVAYLILTSTPIYPTRAPTQGILEVTAIPDPTWTAPAASPTSQPAPTIEGGTQTPAAIAQSPTDTPETTGPEQPPGEPAGEGRSPLCGAAFLPLLAVVAAFRFRRNIRSGTV